MRAKRSYVMGKKSECERPRFTSAAAMAPNHTERQRQRTPSRPWCGCGPFCYALFRRWSDRRAPPGASPQVMLPQAVLQLPMLFWLMIPFQHSHPFCSWLFCECLNQKDPWELYVSSGALDLTFAFASLQLGGWRMSNPLHQAGERCRFPRCPFRTAGRAAGCWSRRFAPLRLPSTRKQIPLPKQMFS